MREEGKCRRPGLRRSIAAIAGTALALTIGLQPAIGHKQTYDSNLQLKVDSVNDTTSQYSGKINSTKGACESGRPVTVTANGVTIATATSVPGGSWSASGPVQAKGTIVIATIPRKILKRNKKHKHKCAPDSAQHRAQGPPGRP
jgi:hypothetical protein